MNIYRRCALSLLGAALLLAGCRSGTTTQAVAPSPTATAVTRRVAPRREAEEGATVRLTMTLPTSFLCPGTSQRSRKVSEEDKRKDDLEEKDCPQTIVRETLGLSFADAHAGLVGGVTTNSPAQKAGLVPSDRIVKCGDSSVTCPSSLVAALRLYQKKGRVVLDGPPSGAGQQLALTRLVRAHSLRSATPGSGSLAW